MGRASSCFQFGDLKMSNVSFVPLRLLPVLGLSD